MDLLGPAPPLTLDDPAWPLGRVAADTRSVVGTAATADGGGSDCRLRGVIVDAGYRVAAGTRIERPAETAEPVVLSLHLDEATRETST